MKYPARLAAALFFLLSLSSFGARALAQEEKKVTLTGSDQMKYDVTAFDVTAGQKVTVTVVNGGKLPKAAMAHNFVLLKPGTDVTAFATAGISHAATDYIAPELAEKVIAHTKMTGPGESDSVTFIAPAAGTYDYICSFPAHAIVGMRGVMTVK
jgi:azurin